MSIAGQYLKIKDEQGYDVFGESDGHDYEGSIDIRGWDWDVADQSSVVSKGAAGKGGSDRSGRSGAAASDEKGIEPALFRFSKAVDSSSPRLMTAMDKNERLQQATFILHEELVPGANDHHKPFLLNVILDDVYVVGYSLSGRASEYRVDLDETWELHYRHIKFDYVSARGLNVEFERKAGSTRGGSNKSAPDYEAQIKKVLEDVEKVKRKGGV